MIPFTLWIGAVAYALFGMIGIILIIEALKAIFDSDLLASELGVFIRILLGVIFAAAGFGAAFTLLRVLV